ncbi:class F sortase [Ornithinimicrobium ciconiae]|uniref:Class F sortase n=1 Tax=Ornithinimicrobium ciconiae TaxID=2594265 RepID=A0A516G7R7_9MICO|nr:class F sortase [Ornithinimicrobium ciconiae]QDO87567.1 class F sortase [Ornithinimicrobium ciconiae]
MNSTPTGGHGRRLSLAAIGLLLALGVGMPWWALAHQVGEPPRPSSDSHAASTSGVADIAGATDSTGESVAPDSTEEGLAPDTTGEATGPGTAGEDAAPTAPDTHRAPRSAATPTPPVTLPASVPVRITIPAIGVDSPLHPLGLDAEGRLEVPSGERYGEAAWYDGSPTPGEAGPAVIEGHVTSQGSVPSVFFELGALAPGDLVDVERTDGTTATFEVYGAESFPKDSFPKTTVYGNTTGAELRLITCGGAYDAERRAHVDNVVVFARLVP